MFASFQITIADIAGTCAITLRAKRQNCSRATGSVGASAASPYTASTTFCLTRPAAAARARYVRTTGRGRTSPRCQGIVIRVKGAPSSRCKATKLSGFVIHLMRSSSKPRRRRGAALALEASVANKSSARRTRRIKDVWLLVLLLRRVRPDQPPTGTFSACPPNCLRIADRSRSAYSASPRELNRS